MKFAVAGIPLLLYSPPAECPHICADHLVAISLELCKSA